MQGRADAESPIGGAMPRQAALEQRRAADRHHEPAKRGPPEGAKDQRRSHKRRTDSLEGADIHRRRLTAYRVARHRAAPYS